MKISPKVPAEIIPVTFDFTELGVTAIDSVYQVGVELATGTDPGVANMLAGSPTVSGATVVQLVRNGVADCNYLLYCLVNKGSERYQIDGTMLCKASHT